jgi:hypothetical protein
MSLSLEELKRRCHENGLALSGTKVDPQSLRHSSHVFSEDKESPTLSPLWCYHPTGRPH